MYSAESSEISSSGGRPRSDASPSGVNTENSLVSKAAGARAFTLMPNRMPSHATERVMPITPILVVAYAACPNAPDRPDADVSVTMRPPPLSFIAR